ncbi:hypothetical protein, partial [Pelomonas sp. Root1444]|uniref:hypothetical protein n=1 Tax=Pelomonas sp. Root1444 TaxID=1736464 RepID=UPI001F34CE9E
SIFENFFSRYSATLLLSLSPHAVCFRIQSSAAKRRDFDLLLQRRQALFEKFFELLSARGLSQARLTSLSARLRSSRSAAVSGCSAVISEAHDFSTGFSAGARGVDRFSSGAVQRACALKAVVAPCISSRDARLSI